MPDRCPHAPRIAERLADPAARLAPDLAAHLPTCAECRAAASAAVRDWPTDRSPSPSLAEWLSEPTAPHTLVVSPFQAEALAGGWLGALELGPYLLLDRLGAGGMGEVFRGWHRLLRREDAIKTVRPELASHADAVRRFLREAESAARVRHPNVVQVYTADRQPNGGYYIAMEFVPGTDLGRLVKAGGPLPVAEACELVAQAADGLQHAFACGLVHRDVKPANLLLLQGVRGEGPGVREGVVTGSAPLTPGPSPLTPCVKVTDFGLARAFADAGSEMTGSGALLGTADYMAPEQAEDAHAADTRADVYALGCTLYFLLTGEAPFAGGSVHTKIARHATAPIPDPVAARPDVPGAVGAVVRRCMAKRPAARFQTPGELAAALRALAAPAPAAVRPKATPNPAVPAHDVSTVTLSTASDAPAPTVRKRRRVWPWAAVAALLLVVVVGVIVAPRGPNRDEGAKGDSRDAEPNKQNGPPKPAPKSPAKWPAWVTVSDPLPPDTPPPARVPLPRAKGTVPWAFDGSCWSARVDKVCAVGFLNDGSVVGGRDGEKKDGSDVGYWEVWPPTGGTPIRAGRPPTTEPYERPVLAHAVGLITDRFQRFDPLTFALMPLSRDVEKLDRDSAEGLDAAVVTPDGKYIAAVATPDGGNGRSERLILQWKAAGDAPPTGGRVTTGAKLTTVAVSADGHTMATLTVEGQVVVHTTQDTRKWFGPKPQKGKRHGEVALDPPGGRVYTAHDAEETIIVWDARTGQEVRRLPLAGWPYALTVSPDGRWLAAGGEAVSVWDLHATPPTRYELADHYAGHLWAVAFDDKSARLAVGGFGHRPPEGGEGVVWLWRKGP